VADRRNATLDAPRQWPEPRTYQFSLPTMNSGQCRSLPNQSSPNEGRSVARNFPAGISCGKAPRRAAGAHVTASTDRPIPENDTTTNVVRRGEQTLDVAYAPVQGRVLAARTWRFFALRQAKPPVGAHLNFSEWDGRGGEHVNRVYR